MRRKLTYANVASTMALVLALSFTPVAAHVGDTVGHFWKAHIKPKLAKDGTINSPRNPVDWTQLKDVPIDIADGDDEVGATGPQGPAGPQGPQGPQGPVGQQGPAGASFVGSPAGGDLTGTYPNPQISPDAVGSAEILNGSLGLTDIARNRQTLQINLPAIAAGTCFQQFIANPPVAGVSPEIGDVIIGTIPMELDHRLIIPPLRLSVGAYHLRVCNIGEESIDPPTATYQLYWFRPVA